MGVGSTAHQRGSPGRSHVHGPALRHTHSISVIAGNMRAGPMALRCPQGVNRRMSTFKDLANVLAESRLRRRDGQASQHASCNQRPSIVAECLQSAALFIPSPSFLTAACAVHILNFACNTIRRISRP